MKPDKWWDGPFGFDHPWQESYCCYDCYLSRVIALSIMIAIENGAQARREPRMMPSKKWVFDIRVMQKDRCAICREPLNAGGVADHIVPLSRGGSNLKRNFQLVHKECNGRKSAKDPVAHMRELGRLL
jgi:HNH endonuclease